MPRKSALWPALLILLLFAAACSGAASAPPPTDIPPTDALPTESPTDAPAAAPTVPPFPTPTVEELVEAPPEDTAGVNALLPDAPASPDEYRADPAELVAATGRPQLIEFFTYW